MRFQMDRWMERSVATRRGRAIVIVGGLATIILIAWVDLRIGVAIPLAPLYIAPIILMSAAMRRWQIVLLGLACTVAAESADAFNWNVTEGLPRDALYWFAYVAVGLYVHETFQRRRVEEAHSAALRVEVATRRDVEEQLRLVVANSSIGIVTVDESGLILDANDAAEQLWGGGDGDSSPLEGMPLIRFVPSLARVQVGREGFERLRTMMQCQGFRANKDPFLADVWFSIYNSPRGRRLTAMVIDSSNETRDREQANLEQVLVSSRIALGALSHEIRNICAAISNVQQNLLLNKTDARQMKEFDALRQLVAALERMASAELSLVKRQATHVHLDNFLSDLYIVVQASLREADIDLAWEITPGLPAVWADSSSLIQVFLNLTRNTQSALHATTDPRVRVTATRRGDMVHIAVSDNGPGIPDPDKLFRPFGQRGSSGLGLYLSKAMMRSFHGELRYEAGAIGATFIVELNVAEVEE